MSNAPFYYTPRFIIPTLGKDDNTQFCDKHLVKIDQELKLLEADKAVSLMELVTFRKIKKLFETAKEMVGKEQWLDAEVQVQVAKNLGQTMLDIAGATQRIIMPENSKQENLDFVDLFLNRINGIIDYAEVNVDIPVDDMALLKDARTKLERSKDLVQEGKLDDAESFCQAAMGDLTKFNNKAAQIMSSGGASFAPPKAKPVLN